MTITYRLDTENGTQDAIEWAIRHTLDSLSLKYEMEVVEGVEGPDEVAITVTILN